MPAARSPAAARRYRFAGSPGWLVGHVLVLAAAVAMVLLGRWQLDVSNAKHFSLQNFGYAIQWWVFSLAALAMWAKVLLDRARAGESAADASPGSQPEPPPTPAPEPVTYRRYVMPQSTDGPPADVDPEQAAYNAYLASLAAHAESTGTRRRG